MTMMRGDASLLRCESLHHITPRVADHLLFHVNATSIPCLKLHSACANGFFRGDGSPILQPHTIHPGRRSFCPLQINAASKGTKPPPKPASRGTIIGAIIVPLLMAGSAVLTGKALLRRLSKEAMEDVEEWERRFNSSRLLTDGKTDEERKLEAESSARAETPDVSNTRSRPKRTE
ncbi:hypothetical protein KP509_33G034100 [Ceratopteris richardii]|uniref:Uncharacterized protein n=1 Tax=Ceratopteris richardii TaxID=49495 RepID=A0A8T2QPY4_CERRI|nr:hypothetical protein KP509_33G034100 [Ceratopteris richardii]KAH7285566.1 hypothetical protein KP509_33G034100 [Ceratopteris richardii]KAH7285567.1 hypothetical protein KP509_33G034100 [Ceratopteris richardii]